MGNHGRKINTDPIRKDREEVKSAGGCVKSIPPASLRNSVFSTWFMHGIHASLVWETSWNAVPRNWGPRGPSDTPRIPCRSGKPKSLKIPISLRSLGNRGEVWGSGKNYTGHRLPCILVQSHFSVHCVIRLFCGQSSPRLSPLRVEHILQAQLRHCMVFQNHSG